MSKSAEKILKRLYDNYQNGNEWDKALKDIELYANTKDKWISVDTPPESGIEVTLYSKKWINEDFNPNGTRIGFKDDVSGWVSSYWCNTHDEYHTRTSDEDDHDFNDFKAVNQIPTHWKRIEPPTVNIER